MENVLDANLRESFLSHKQTDGKSNNTIKNYRIDITAFGEYLESHALEVQTITLQDLDKWKSYMVLEYTMPDGRHLKPASINRTLTVIRELMKYCQYIGIRKDNPSTLLKTVKLPKRLPKPFELSEVRKILTSISGENQERDRAILFIFLMTGMRLSELANLTLDSLQGDSLRIIGKGDKERICLLDDQTLEILNDYLRVRKLSNCNAIFLTDRNTGISARGIQEMVGRRLKQADVRIMCTHTLRHTAATMMLEGGADIRIIQETLGHADIRTTTIYASVTNAQKKKTVQNTQKMIGVTIKYE